VLRLAKQNGLNTPHLALMYSLLKGLQVNILKQRAAKAQTA
jgi:ketopantoate reductase